MDCHLTSMIYASMNWSWARNPGNRSLRLHGPGSHPVRTLPLLMFLVLTFQCVSRGDDIIPGIVTFDPPAFLHGGTSGQDSDDKFGKVTGVRQYFAKDNNIKKGERLVVINARKVAPSIGRDNQKYDDIALRAWMQHVTVSSLDATNITKVTDAKVSGEPALLISYQVAQPNWPKKQEALFRFEVYWVTIATNRVMEIELIADTSEHLETLRTCLDRFTIRVSDNVIH
jgi:hypothetical protein